MTDWFAIQPVVAGGLGMSRNVVDYLPMLLFLAVIAATVAVYRKLSNRG